MYTTTVKNLKRTPLWSYLFIVGFIILYTSDINISTDMGLYMNSAQNIFSGKGYTNVDGSPVLERGPFFPLMISVSYRLKGISPWSAFWTVRIFCLLNPILIFFLGNKLIDKWVGFAAALLVLSSYTLNYWSYRHIDAVWPAFSILFIIFTILALEKNSFIFFITSGILIGLAYNVKQSAILLFPLPFLLFLIIENYRKKIAIAGLLGYSLILILMIAPWIYYVFSHTSDFKYALLGKGGVKASHTIAHSDSLMGIKSFLLGIFYYCSGRENSLFNNFLFAPAFICTWIINIYFVIIKKDKASIILTTLLFLLLPYISIVGKNNLRVGQLILFLLLSYLVLARFCIAFLRWITERGYGSSKVWQNVYQSLSVFVIITLIFVQTFISFRRDKGNIEFIKRSYIFQRIIKKNSSFEVKGNFGPHAMACGKWIKKNIPTKSRFVVDKPRPIYFYSGGGQFTFYHMPIIYSPKYFFLPAVSPKDISVTNKNKLKSNVIFMSSYADEDVPKNFIAVLPENLFLSFIEEKNIEYIIVQRSQNYLSLYFDKNVSFLKIKEFGNGSIKIYKVVDIKPMNYFKPLITLRLAKYLYVLKNEKQNKFKWYVDKFFGPVLGWSSMDVEKLTLLSKKNNLDEYTIVKKGRVYRRPLINKVKLKPSYKKSDAKNFFDSRC